MAMATAVAGLRRRTAEAMLWRRAAEAMLWRSQATAAAQARRRYASAEESGRCYVVSEAQAAEMALPIATRFENFIQKFGRTYEDENEKAYRFEVFKDNVKFIDAHRDVCGVGPFADMWLFEVPTGAKWNQREWEQMLFKYQVSSASSGMQEPGN